MKILETPTVDPDIQADLEEVARLVSEGKTVTDPELRRRIRERSEAIGQQLYETRGPLDIVVDLIRESRDEA